MDGRAEIGGRLRGLSPPVSLFDRTRARRAVADPASPASALNPVHHPGSPGRFARDQRHGRRFLCQRSRKTRRKASRTPAIRPHRGNLPAGITQLLERALANVRSNRGRYRANLLLLRGGGMNRYHLVHVTEFHYDGPVSESYNEVRLRPIQDDRQSCISFRLITNPESRGTAYRDA